jgi:hypothetical protein
MKAILSHHHLDFTKRDFVVVVADTLPKAIERFNKEFKNKYVATEGDKGASALCIVEDNGACALLFCRKTLCASLICHEVTHATNGMFAHIGIELNKGSDEAFAYHNDMLFRTVAELLREHAITIPLLP